MPSFPITVGNYGRARLGLPDSRLVNAYVEQTKGGPEGFVATTRPGLQSLFTNGNGPILAIYRQQGLFNGDIFTVSGTGFYRQSTKVSTVPYSQCPRMAAANGTLALVSGGALYTYNGTSAVLQRTFDDNITQLPSFSGAAVLDNIFVYPVQGSNQFFFSYPGRASVINGLSFSSAQANPDAIIDVQVLSDELYFFKQTTTEIWQFTGNVNAPFAISAGRTYTKGCAAQASVVQLDNAIMWVGNDAAVYRTGVVPDRKSTSFIEERLRAAGSNIQNVTAARLLIEGHVFYILNIPSLNESYAYDCQTGEWARWGTLDGTADEPRVFLGRLSSGSGLDSCFGSNIDGRVFGVDPTYRTDDGKQIRVIVTGGIWIPGGVVRCNNISLHCVRGVGTNTFDPIVSMRFSDDGGRTFTPWLRSDLGLAGAYGIKATWWNLGYIRQPGRLVEFSVTDSVNVTIEGASFNEARP